ncbi:MAG: prolyl oligopeptidase family serine peptidase [Phycisphaerales bacterium]|nr:prolyl oligopeptidase family serine peptidase [Phycisphaerales bacterium]
MHTLLLTLAAVILSAFTTTTQSPTTNPAPTTTHHFSITHEDQHYDYVILIPQGVSKLDPAILFLHGFGESGTDGFKQLAVGLPPAVRKDPERWPFIIIVPQKPTFMSEWEDHETALLKMLDQAATDGYINPDKLAITGLSQGGHGSIIIAANNPERFKAAAPVCGYIERRVSPSGERLEEKGATPTDPDIIAAANALKDIPIHLFHGDIDDIVPPEESRSLHQALQELDADTQYTEYKDTNHNSWDPAYATESLPAWFMKHMN